jgi:DNA polymerase
MKYECEGDCKAHQGVVVEVEVYYQPLNVEWGRYHYCQTAIKDDIAAGFTVTPIKNDPPSEDTLVIDFETYYDTEITLRKMNYSEYVQHTHILCLGYIWRGKLNVLHDPTEFLNSLDWSTITVIGHNLLFDALILKTFYGHTAARYVDTLGMARHVHPCRKHGLDDLADLYAPALKKTQALKYVRGKTWSELTEQQQTELAQYCRNDVVLTAMLYDKWKTKFHEWDLLDHTIKLFINPRLELNSAKLEALILEEKLEADRLLTLHKLSREKVRSDAQFAEHLSGMGYIVPTKFSAKQQKAVPAFAKSDSQWQEFYLHNQELQPLLDLKRSINSSIKETRTNRLISSVTNGKSPVAYNYHGAFTGRWAGANLTNYQSLPRGSELRNAIVAPQGYTLIASDLSQIEARMIAWLAEENRILDVFRNKQDLYCAVASDIFDRPINKKEHPDERWVGKCAALGLSYGMSAEKFKLFCMLQGRDLSIEFATKVVETYRLNYHKIPAFWRHMQKMLYVLAHNNENIGYKMRVENQHLILPSGRAMHYEGLQYIEQEGQWRLLNGKKVYGALLVENLTQGAARDVLAEKILTIEQRYPVVLHTHDEVCCLVPTPETEVAAAWVHQQMITPPTWCSDIPLDAETHTGQTYGECK